MKVWKRIDPTVITRVGWRTVVTKTFRMPDDQQLEFQIFNPEDTQNAGCVALTADKQVIVARQYRPGPEKIMDEIAGGGVETGEDPRVAAIRELREETGYRPGKTVPLGVVYKDAYNNSTWHYYLCTDCELTAKGPRLENGEHVEVELLGIDDFIDNARQGRMTDTEAVFLAYDQLRKIQKQ